MEHKWSTLLSALAANRKNVGGNLISGDGAPLDLERAPIAEQRTPHPILDVNLDMETPIGVVVPLADLGYAREGHGETEPDPAFVKALLV